MANYKINDAALDDIATIFSFGIDTFGLEAAITYVEGLKLSITKLMAASQKSWPLLVGRMYRQDFEGKALRSN